jgi:hypothetical protein
MEEVRGRGMATGQTNKMDGKAIREKGGKGMVAKGIQNSRKKLSCSSSLTDHALVQV